MAAKRRNQRAATYGTDDFAAILAEREAALGLVDVSPIVGIVTITPTDPSTDQSSAVADVDVDDGETRRDRWGNPITSALGWFGQHTIRHWSGNRTVYVCGAAHIGPNQPGSHLEYWTLDGRMGRGQGYICARCFTLEAGLYALPDRTGAKGTTR